MSLRARIISFVVVIALGASLYMYLSAPDRRAGSVEWDWYTGNLRVWKSGRFVSISDEQAVMEAVRDLVQSRYTGPDVGLDSLERDLAGFILALGVNEPGEYLTQVAPYRELRSAEEVHNERFLHGWHREAFGTLLPREVDPGELFRKFWHSHPEWGARPTHVSGDGAMQVARTRPQPTRGTDRTELLASQTYPKFTVDRRADAWIGPYAQSFPRLTRPATSLEEVLSNSETTLGCFAHFAVRTADDKVFPLGLYLYFAPVENQWHVEWLTHLYPEKICWPY